jgi:hypothetical protein
VTTDPSLELGPPEALFKAPRWSARMFADQSNGGQLTTTYDVSPDGSRFLVRQRTERTSTATLLLNWQQLLTQAANARQR